MELKIDSREPNKMKEAMEIAADESDVINKISIEQLETADFVAGDTGIERKEASDFAASVQDRRISEQGDRMVEEFSHRYVVLEGSGLYELKYTNIGANSLIGQQVSLAAKRSINLINTDGVDGTAFAVRRIVERVADDEAVGHVKTVDVESDRTDVAMLSQIRGISTEKAEKILDEVPISVICSMSHQAFSPKDKCVARFTKVDGVGEKTAEKIFEAFE